MPGIEYLTALGIERKFINLTFENFHDKEIANFCKAYIVNFKKMREIGQGLLISGCTGSGKTMLASLILKNLVNRLGILGYVLNMDQIAELLGEYWKDDSKAENRNLKLYSSMVLIIDNYPTLSSRSRDSREILAQLVRKRMANNVITILTTPLKPSELAAHSGDELRSLLSEAMHLVELPEVDYRLKLVARNLAIMEGLKNQNVE